MVLLESDSFLSELTRLFQKQKNQPAGQGSITMTMKRYDGRTKPKPRPSKANTHHEPTEFKCLIRAALGSKKIATVVGQKDVNRFQMAYANLLKGNIDGLKKKEKKSAKGKVKTAKAT